MTTTLTRTQREALADLQRTGHQWPLLNGRLRGDGYTQTSRYARRTLQALVDAGLARWERRHGVMPHVVLVDPAADERRRRRVQAAALYVTTRFYPPLPVEYADLLVDALAAVVDGDADTRLDVTGLPVIPRCAVVGDDDRITVAAADLLDVLRIDPAIYTDEEN